MSAINEFDVLVIGAGISGIAASKCFLDYHPHSRLVILDKDNCVGGSWNSRRGYDTFWTQWTVGTAEFSDQPMPRPPDEDLYYEFFKAKHTTKYLENYVDQHSYAGQTLRDRIKLSVEVTSVLKHDSIWAVSATEKFGGIQHTFQTSKLIMASGLTSIPNMPSLPAKQCFRGQLLHHEDFGSASVLTSPEVQDVVILGAGKSSADMAYEAVKAGKTVSWVLKATNTTGPGFFLSPKGKGPYKNAFEVGMTRIAGSFAPSFMYGINWWTRLLHSSKYGVRMMAAFWGTIDKDIRKAADFQRECLQNFHLLEPHSSIFWQNGTGGLLNHEDFYDTISQNVRIFCGDVKYLTGNFICLESGEEIPADAILCGTGWVPSHQYFSQSQCRTLGLPYILEQEPESEKAHWIKLETEADHTVVNTFPQLANPPPHYHKRVTHSPFRLYRHVVPISESGDSAADRSIVFIGQIGVGNYFPAVECQSLWATAYLDGKLNLPSKEDQEKDVALCTTWCRRRYLSSGEKGNKMTVELVAYMDTLLQDMGLNSHRKGWFKDIFDPMWAKDFKGLKAEFTNRFGYE